jgi:hypothetical protein
MSLAPGPCTWELQSIVSRWTPRDFVDNLDARAAIYLESTANVSPGGWSHYENPLQCTLYVPSGTEE